MKIDNSSSSPLTGTAKPAADQRAGKAQVGTGTPARQDGAGPALSSLGVQLQAVVSRLDQLEVVDAARVAEVKQAIAEDRYRINPEVIADRLLQTVQDLIRDYKA